MHVRIKICGLRDADNILEVAAFRPDFMGFIFYPPSPRYVGEKFSLPRALPSSIRKTGVFVNEHTDIMVKRAEAYGLDYLQLHGHESPEQCEALKDRGMKIIKAFSVGESFDFSLTLPYQSIVDYFLFDTKGKHYGGNAIPFDWSLLEGYNLNVPYFLSGGLSPENIKGIEKINSQNLYALDVNSGVESQPGTKDINRLKLLYKQLDALH